jgi:hypothetical protein
MTHSLFIEILGGTTAVAKALNVSPQNVTNWRRRRIPWKYRFKMVRLAEIKNVKAPDKFMEPQ